MRDIKQPKLQILLSILFVALMTVIFLITIQLNIKQVYIVKLGIIEAGKVSDPSVVKQWIDSQNKKLAKQYPQANVKLMTEELTYVPVKLFGSVHDDRQALHLLQELLPSKAYGAELVIDGKRVGIVKDKQTAARILKYVKERQVAQVNNNRAQQKNGVKVLSAEPTKVESENVSTSEIQSIEWVESYQTNDVAVEPTDIVDPQKVIKMIEVGKLGDQMYTVQEGDCVSCIAQKFNIPPSVIYKNNPWIEEDRITVGDKLNLTVKKPLLSLRTIEKIVEREEIHFSTNYENDAKLRAGATKEVVKGQDGLREITMIVTKIGGEIVQEKTINEEVLKEPVTALVLRGTKIIPGEGTGKFMVPVRGATLSSRYGMRGGRMHKGIDFTSSNRNIVAADTGRVVYVGWSNGYGNTIIVDHRNGFQTKYAHLSRFKVRSGENVEKGEVIGIMGNTGNSDGVHLHFEVVKGGRIVNPSKYLFR
jgi:murein DD-endopeptidase MepM/ murein hydrolase activator NlpD